MASNMPTKTSNRNRSETDEAAVFAANILWKLSEYHNFVGALLQAGAGEVCCQAGEDIGSPRSGPLQHWLQVSMQVLLASLSDR